MAKNIAIISIFIFQCALNFVYSQSSASCGKCGGAVSIHSSVGDRCPHCGVIWGRENTSYKETYTTPNYNYNNYNYNNYSFPNTGRAYVTSNSNLRAVASKSGYVKTVVPAYSYVTVNGRYGEWYSVSYSDYRYTYDGYIHRSLIQF